MSCRVGTSEVCKKYIVVQKIDICSNLGHLTLNMSVTVHIKDKYAFGYSIHQLSLLRVPSFEEK